MKPKKLIALLLLFCLAGSLLLASCETDDESSAPESVSGETSWVSEYQNQNGDYVATTSGKRYDGETITFLTCGEEPFYESEIVPNIETYENGAEQTYPQIINDDLKLRADDLEDKLGLKLEEIQYHSPVRKNGEMLQYIVQGNLSSTEDYQVVVPCLYDGATLALDGHL